MCKKAITLLLIEDNVDDCKEFEKCVNHKNNVRFVGITNSDIEGLKYVKEYSPDAIILDLELHKGSGNDTSFGFLEAISKMDFEKKPEIVVTTIVSSEAVYNYLHSKGVELIFYKKQPNYSAENVINTVLLLNDYSIDTPISNIKYNTLNGNSNNDNFEKTLCDMINKELDLIGVGLHLQGRKYLFDAIYFILNENKSNYRGTVIQFLSNKYKRSSSTISRAMQNAILHAWRRSSLEDLELHYTARINYETGLPTPTEFMYYYADKIKKMI